MQPFSSLLFFGTAEMTLQQSIAESSAELAEMGLRKMSIEGGEGEGEGEEKGFVFKNRATRLREWYEGSSFFVQATLAISVFFMLPWLILGGIWCSINMGSDLCHWINVAFPCLILGFAALFFIWQKCFLER